MKNLNTRTVLITLLVAASLSSYTFLKSESNKISNQQVEQTEMQSQIVLPDIEMAKKICRVARAILHPFQEK